MWDSKPIRHCERPLKPQLFMPPVIILAENADQIKIETYGKAVADGVGANPTDFPNPVPTPEAVRNAIKTYVNSIKSEREKSIATDEATESLRKTAIGMVNNLISYAVFAVGGDVDKLRNANIEFRKKPEKKEQKKLTIKTSRMGTERGSYFFRLTSMAGSNVIGVFRKDTIGDFQLVEAYALTYFTLKNQPSGSQTYMFKGRQGNNDWDDATASDAVTVNVP